MYVHRQLSGRTAGVDSQLVVDSEVSTVVDLVDNRVQYCSVVSVNATAIVSPFVHITSVIS